MYQTYAPLSETDKTPARIKALRDWLTARSLDGLLIPHDDAYKNEYLPPCFERLRWASGFSGSAGLAILLLEEAAIFVDGRYTLQVENEVDHAIFERHQIPQIKPAHWLAEHAGPGARIGYDPRLHMMDAIAHWTRQLADKDAEIELAPLDDNPVDDLWLDRPPLPRSSATPHPLEYAGKSARDKIGEIQQSLRDEKLDSFVLSDLASIAWLFNIRGADVPHTPLVLCHAILHAERDPELIIDPAKLSDEVKQTLARDMAIYPQDALEERLASAAQSATRLGIDKTSTSHWLNGQLESGGQAEILAQTNPCIGPKAIKNEAEIKGMRAAHKRDGVAVSRFLCWLENNATGLDEIGAAKQLESFRHETGKLRDISFETISGSGPHGAIVHYRVDEGSNRALADGSLYLVDSGGQYPDGTTDITRTIAIGTPSNEMRRHYTLVLKGHIALARARFPKGARGVDLDILARQYLWQAGLDYDHGTGHGVGAYLGVHEGPQNISKRGMTALQPGMVISNEPGYYREDHYGIRIENLVLVTPPEIPHGGERPMLGFETLTLAPLDLNLIDATLLDATEMDWLDDYHARVFADLSLDLSSDRERAWLQQATRPVHRRAI